MKSARKKLVIQQSCPGSPPPVQHVVPSTHLSFWQLPAPIDVVLQSGPLWRKDSIVAAISAAGNQAEAALVALRDEKGVDEAFQEILIYVAVDSAVKDRDVNVAGQYVLTQPSNL